MPPKKSSNKTAHVLNLLTTTGENDAGEQVVAKEAPQTETSSASGSKTKREQQKATNIRAGTTTGESIATLLLKEFDDGTLSGQSSKGGKGESENDVMDENSANDDLRSASDSSSDGETEQQGSQPNFESDSDNEYVTVNIVEDIVQSKAPEFAKNFGVCDCHHCISDVIAIALNEIPPRYTVTQKGMLFAKVNSYALQHFADVNQALTKACMIVIESPRH